MAAVVYTTPELVVAMVGEPIVAPTIEATVPEPVKSVCVPGATLKYGLVVPQALADKLPP